MSKQLNIVCGVDIHKRFLVATTLGKDGTKYTRRFENKIHNLINFRDWLIELRCRRVAIESTGRYWHPLRSILEGACELIVANPYMIKHIPGRKTDVSDSEWIAELCLNDLIAPSRIFVKDDQDLRKLTRQREAYVKELSREKNRVHQILDSCGITLSEVISDIFGVGGMYILTGLAENKSPDEILERLPVKRLRKNASEIRAAIMARLNLTDIFILAGSLKVIA